MSRDIPVGYNNSDIIVYFYPCDEFGDLSHKDLMYQFIGVEGQTFTLFIPCPVHGNIKGVEKSLRKHYGIEEVTGPH